MTALVNQPIDSATPRKFGFLTLIVALIVVTFLGMLSLMPRNGGTGGAVLQGGTETPTPEVTVDATPANVEVVATPNFGTSISLGETVEGALTKGSLETNYAVEAPADGMIHAVLRSKDFNVALSHGVFDPATGGGGGGGGGGGPILNKITMTEIYVPIKKGNILSLFVTSISHVETGNFTLTTSFAPIQRLPFGEGLSGKIDEQNSFAYYAFHAMPGDRISVSVAAHPGVDLTMSLEESTDNLGVKEAYDSYQLLGGPLTLQDDDSGSEQSPELYNVLIPRENDYRILLKPAVSGTQGEYTILLMRHEAASLDNAVQPIYLSSKAYNGAVTFEGKAGETVQLHAKLMIGSGLIRAVALQNGKVIATFNIQADSSEAITVPDDGKVVILLDNAGIEIIDRLAVELSLLR